MNKKDLPVALLQSLSRLNVQLLKLVENLDDLIQVEYNENKLLMFKDTDINSQFKFEIKNLSLSNGSPVYIIENSPSSNVDNKAISTNQSEKSVLILFQTWIGWLKVYQSSHLTPEDEIQKRYVDEFYSEFKFIDENADKDPFSIEQQLFLNDYIKNSQKKLLALQEGKTEEEIFEINNLIDEAETIKKSLTNESKNKIIMRLSKFWGKTRKTGIEIFKEIFVEVMSEIGKKLLLGN